MDYHHRILYLSDVCHQRHVEERESRRGVPSVVGVERPSVIATLRLIVGMIILHKLRSVLRQRIHHSSGARVCPVAVVLSALRAEHTAHGVARSGTVSLIKISVCRHAAHVIHRRSHRRLYAGVHSCRVESESAPPAYAENADARGIHIIANGKPVYRRAEVFGIDVWRRHIARTASALTRKRRVEGYGEEPSLCQFLSIKT